MSVHASQTPFDPAAHLIKTGPNDYLEVKWGLVWLRAIYPDASIRTELVELDGTGCVMRATVSWPVSLSSGETHIVSASGYASGASGDRYSMLETTETSAIGRALEAAGFSAEHLPSVQERARAGAASKNAASQPRSDARRSGGAGSRATARQKAPAAATDNPATVRDTALKLIAKASTGAALTAARTFLDDHGLADDEECKAAWIERRDSLKRASQADKVDGQ